MRTLVSIVEPDNELVSQAVTAARQPVEAAAAAAGGNRTDGAIGSLATVFALRRAVFVTEQGVDSSIEWDGLDDAATHFLALDESRPVGTARLRWLDEATAKCERVAVRAADRNAGWGRWLMTAVDDHAADTGATRCVLHAQQSAVTFYEKQGYQAVGEPFSEAGIPHRKMVRLLANRADASESASESEPESESESVSESGRE